MPLHELAGKPAPPSLLTDIPELITAYFSRIPDLDDSSQRVSFGTSGHRGAAFSGSFNEAHILACAQAACDFRKASGISGPLFLGKDTHALSTPSFLSTLEVLAANGIEVVVQRGGGSRRHRLSPTLS